MHDTSEQVRESIQELAWVFGSEGCLDFWPVLELGGLIIPAEGTVD